MILQSNRFRLLILQSFIRLTPGFVMVRFLHTRLSPHSIGQMGCDIQKYCVDTKLIYLIKINSRHIWNNFIFYMILDCSGFTLLIQQYFILINYSTSEKAEDLSQ